MSAFDDTLDLEDGQPPITLREILVELGFRTKYLRERLEKVEQQMATTQGQINTIDATIVSLKTTLDTQNTLIGNLDTSIQALKAQIASGVPQPDFTQVDNDLAALQGTVNKTVTGLAQDISDANPSGTGSTTAPTPVVAPSLPSNVSTDHTSTTNLPPTT